MKPDLSVYVITDRSVRGRSHEEVAHAAIAGGATALQLREKQMDSRALYELAVRLRGVAREAGVPFLIDDRVDIALAAGADGVHVGQDDLPVSVARRLVGPGRIVGASAETVDEALRAERDGADYLGVGPVFGTSTKPDAGMPIGIGGLAAVAHAVQIPVVGIGGITSENADEVIRAGAAGVAVISAVAAADDMMAATQRLVEVVRAARR